MLSSTCPARLSLVFLLLCAAGKLNVAGQGITCSKPSNTLSRPSECPPFPSCFACPSCSPGQKATFRPSVPPSWHGHLNDTSLFNAWSGYSYNILDLSALGIVYVKPGLFEQLSLYVEELRLERNNLSSLEDGVLNGLWPLRFINVSNNALSFVGPRVFHTREREHCLQIVDMSHNLLTYMESWPYYDAQNTKLELFDMSHNRISSFRNALNISFDVIKWRFTFQFQCGTCRNAMYDLQWNNFTTVDSALGKTGLTVFQPKLNMPYDLVYFNLSLAQNDWICDCHFYQLRKSLDDNIWDTFNHQRIPLIPVCRHPHALQNQSLHRVTLDQLVCNITRACPPRCLCQKIPAKKTILVDCQNAGLTSLPFELPEDDLPLSIMLAGNGISHLEWRSYLSRVKRLNLRGNRLQRVSDEAIKSLQSQAEFLDLSHNHLSAIPSSLAAVAISKVNLTFNPLQCSCDLQWLPDWEGRHWNLTCNHGNLQVEMASMATTLDCSHSLAIPIAVSVALVVALAVGGIVLYRVWLRKQLPKWGFRVCRHVVPGPPAHRPEEDGPGRAFDRLNDVYISLDDDDDAVRRWVIGTLLPLLENERPQMRVFLRCRDAEFAADIADNIYNGLRCSRRLLVVLSRDYCNVRKYCLHELDAWLGEVGTKEAAPVILIYEHVEEKRMVSTTLHRLLEEDRLVFRRGDRHSLVDVKFALWRN